ncbi:MAG: hypothetical protein ANABAC_0395 [Anaerolineae bacterium]|nr:MAG: hypothetical protein ANABAC_0395 [Anaerolineae bacterium]
MHFPYSVKEKCGQILNFTGDKKFYLSANQEHNKRIVTTRWEVSA